MNNIQSLVASINTQIAKIQCVDLGMLIDWKKITLIVNPIFYAILNSYADKKNANQMSQMTYLKELQSLNYEVIPSSFCDTSYDGTAGSDSTIIVVGDIENSFVKRIVSQNEYQSWSPWEKYHETDNGVRRNYYSRDKDIEWAIQSVAYGMRKTDGELVFKKPVMHIKTTPNASS